MNKTFIHGKDAPLEDTIAKAKSIIKRLGYETQIISRQNPLPNLYSILIQEKNKPYLYANGKGINEKAALASALGEFVERLATGYFFADFYLGEKKVYQPKEKFFPMDSKNFLSKKLWKFYDPNDKLTPENLLDINCGNPKRGVRCLPFVSMSTGETTFFPVNILDNIYVSNGMAAGNSKAEAITQALSEIIERHVKFKIISAGISLPEIDENRLRNFSDIYKTIEKIKNAGRKIIFYDASLGGVFPVICAALFDKKKHNCLLSFGAHPNFEIAAARAITELFQGRSLESLGEISNLTDDRKAVAAPENLELHFIDSTGLVLKDFFEKKSDYNLSNWNLNGTTQEEMNSLKQLIERLGFEIFVYDIEFNNFYVCRIVTPGFSEIYPIDDMIYNNKNQRAFVQDDY